MTKSPDTETRSRHKAKQQARVNGSKTFHDIAQQLGIYSFTTRRKYHRITVEFLKFMQSKYSIKDAQLITNDHVQKFLLLKALTVKISTLRMYAAGLNKLAVALTKYDGEPRDWYETTQAVKKEIPEDRRQTPKPRAYKNPEAIIENMTGPAQLYAKLQLYGGLRLSEASRLTKDNLRPKTKQLYLTCTKGGRHRSTITLPDEVFNAVKMAITLSQDKTFRIMNQQSLRHGNNLYVNALKKAVEATKQTWKGSHGLRHSYVQQRYKKLQAEGRSEEHILLKIANEIGHSRGNITKYYLRN